MHPTGDGLGSLSVTNLPLPVLRAVQDALRQYADAAQTPGDDRTRQQRMVDTSSTSSCAPAPTAWPRSRPSSPSSPPSTPCSAATTPARSPATSSPPTRSAPSPAPSACCPPKRRPQPTRRRERRGAASDPPRPRRSADSPTPTLTPSRPAATAVDAGLTDLLAARTLHGTALAARPHIALVDELTGQLLALTDAAGLRAGRALGPPPPTEAYRPTDPLKRYVQTRDRRCRFPGCRRPAAPLRHPPPHPLARGRHRRRQPLLPVPPPPPTHPPSTRLATPRPPRRRTPLHHPHRPGPHHPTRRTSRRPQPTTQTDNGPPPTTGPPDDDPPPF